MGRLVPAHYNPSTRAPVLGVMKFTTLVDPSLVITSVHTYSLSDLCLGVEKKTGGHEIYNFGRPSLCNHYFTLSLS